MATRPTKKNSAFLAFKDLDSDGSDDERVVYQQEQKEKQKAKKKSSKKKKNSENNELKELAMCSGTTTKKSKAKTATPPSSAAATVPEQTQSPAEPHDPPSPPQQAAPPAPSFAAVAKAVPEAPEAAKDTAAPAKSAAPRTLESVAASAEAATASTTTAIASAFKSATAPAGRSAKGSTAPQQSKKDQEPAEASSATRPSAYVAPHARSTPVAEIARSKSPESPTSSTTTPSTESSPAPPQLPTQPEYNGHAALGVIYTPTHITVTRADGQASRNIAVEEMMDQLFRYQQVNTQLTMVNRSLSEQLQRDAGMVATLQNEVTMFRQMCLNLQAEATQLRMALADGMPPHALNGSNGSARSTPPPGMS